MFKKPDITTFQLIADILSFENKNDNLKTQLKTSQIDWDNLVKIASKHLVLTTVYCRLKQKDLLNYLPIDLQNYLEELTSINKNRNKTLIKEAYVIANILDQNNINYVFIKGMALLLGDYYQDLGERMVGDFDILIANEDLDLSFNLLKKEGYDQLVNFNYATPNFRHLPRQINPKKLAAVELHRHILNPSNRDLISISSVLNNKLIIKHISIPSNIDLNQITILTTELNDDNYFYNILNFKNSYDSLVLGLEKHIKNSTEFTNSKYTSHYLALNSIWFNQLRPDKTTLINQIKKKSYLLKMKYGTLGKILNSTKFASLNISKRISLVLKNRNYRKYLVKSLILRKS